GVGRRPVRLHRRTTAARWWGSRPRHAVVARGGAVGLDTVAVPHRPTRAGRLDRGRARCPAVRADRGGTPRLPVRSVPSDPRTPVASRPSPCTGVDVAKQRTQNLLCGFGGRRGIAPVVLVLQHRLGTT